MCHVAIVILNWNGAQMLRQYLPSVIDNSNDEGVEIIVADNASTDESLKVMNSLFPQVRTICLDRNYGFAEGYNRALREVEAQYYLLLNSDVEIRQPHWLLPMINYMDTHPKVAACQPKLLKLTTDFTSPHFEYAGAAGGFIDRFGYPYCRGRIFDTVEPDQGQYDDIASVMWTTGAAMLVRAETYWQAGGLDHEFFAHMEEIDLCWRLRIMGYQLVCIPQSTAYHLGGATLAQGNPRKTFLNFRNNLLMLYKNLPSSQLQQVIIVRRLLDGIAAIQFLIKGDWNNMRAIFKAHKAFSKLKSHYHPIRKHIQNYRLTMADSSITDTSPLFIIWEYFVKRKKTFNQL